MNEKTKRVVRFARELTLQMILFWVAWAVVMLLTWIFMLAFAVKQIS